MFLYLPANTEGAIYCRLVDIELGECIVKLNFIERKDHYDVYQVSLDNHVTVQPGLCQLYFLLIQGNKAKTFRVENIHLDFGNFSALNKLYLLDKSMKEMKTYVNQIEKYTELNIQLYKDIREAAEIND